MSRFIESICCIDGEMHNLALHQKRVDHTFKCFFDQYPPIRLRETITGVPKTGKHKCRIVYDHSNIEVGFEAYPKRHLSSLQIVVENHIKYDFKYENRSELTSLFKQRGSCDDILIVRNGMLADSYFANLVFFDGTNYYTPKNPLLNGTKRQLLIEQGKITEVDISLNSLNTFRYVSLINAMLDLEEVVISVDRIYS